MDVYSIWPQLRYVAISLFPVCVVHVICTADGMMYINCVYSIRWHTYLIIESGRRRAAPNIERRVF